DGRLFDLTRAARYLARQPGIASVTAAGVIRAHGDGTAQVTIEVAGHKSVVGVEVSGSATPRTFHFENDIVPLLSRHGCNAAGCHGSALGQNGFKLSVFGSDPQADYAALVREGPAATPRRRPLLRRPRSRCDRPRQVPVQPRSVGGRRRRRTGERRRDAGRGGGDGELPGPGEYLPGAGAAGRAGRRLPQGAGE